MDKFVYQSGSETSNLAYFLSKSLNYTAMNFFLQKLSTLTIATFTISTRTDFTLETGVKYFRAITMCTPFTHDRGCDHSTFILIGDVYCPNTKCLGKLCLHKETFQSLGRSAYQYPQCESVCQVRNFFWWSNKFLSLLAWSRGLNCWRDSKINSRCYWRCVLSWQVLFQQREMRVAWRLCNNSEIHLWLRKVWNLIVVHKIPLMLQEHVKTTETEKHAFSLLQNRSTWYPTNNYYITSHSNWPNIETKNCV